MSEQTKTTSKQQAGFFDFLPGPPDFASRVSTFVQLWRGHFGEGVGETYNCPPPKQPEEKCVGIIAASIVWSAKQEILDHTTQLETTLGHPLSVVTKPLPKQTSTIAYNDRFTYAQWASENKLDAVYIFLGNDAYYHLSPETVHHNLHGLITTIAQNAPDTTIILAGLTEKGMRHIGERMDIVNKAEWDAYRPARNAYDSLGFEAQFMQSPPPRPELPENINPKVYTRQLESMYHALMQDIARGPHADRVYFVEDFFLSSKVQFPDDFKWPEYMPPLNWVLEDFSIKDWTLRRAEGMGSLAYALPDGNSTNSVHVSKPGKDKVARQIAHSFACVLKDDLSHEIVTAGIENLQEHDRAEPLPCPVPARAVRAPSTEFGLQ